MAVRQKLNENKKVGMGVGAAILIIAVGLMAFQLRRGNGNAVTAPTSAFYTDDNGKTFFKDQIRIVPFDHNGRQAYRADVFKCPDGREFVGLIYRFTDSGRREMERYLASKVSDPDGSSRLSIEHRGMQVKPINAAEKAWTYNDDVTAERLQGMVKCPSGVPAQLVTP
jgi:hypothetical protein